MSKALTHLFGLLSLAAREDGHQVAMVDQWGRGLTYQDWLLEAEQWAQRLTAVGVRPGDRVGMQMRRESWLEAATLFFAILRAGAVPVPLVATLPAEAVARLRQVLDLALVISEVLRESPNGELPGITEHRRLAETDATGALPGRPQEPSTPAALLPTSGTSGRVRVVTISHANLLHAYGDGVSRAATRPVQLYVPVMGTQLGLVGLLRPLGHLRPKCLIVSTFKAKTVIGLIAEHQVAEITLVPHLARKLAAAAQLNDVSSLTHVVLTGDNSGPSVLEEIAKAFPAAGIYNYYASTESYPAAIFTRFDPARPRSLGVAVPPTQVRIHDGEQPLLDGEPGPVWLRTEGAPARTYLQEPHWREQSFDDGWIRTGDYGYLDDRGGLVLVDREADLVNIGGSRVGTLAVENVLLGHPAVEDAAVYGLRTRHGYDVLVAMAVVNTGVAVDELRVHLGAVLPAHAVPQRIDLVKEIPRNASGKALKYRLRADAASATVVDPDLVAELKVIWQEILGPDTDVTEDSDFLDLGGDSLAYVELAARVDERLGAVLEINDYVQASSLLEMAELLTLAGTTRSQA